MRHSAVDSDVEITNLISPASSVTKQKLVLCLVLSVITLLLYNRVVSAEFINFDDPLYVVNNSHVQAGMTWETVKWAFAAYEVSNWHPLTWLSHALDWQLFQSNPAGHHYVNVLFHAANAVLLFLVLLSATRRAWLSWIVAVIWAVHPVQVESVVWVAERRNVLSMFFFLVSLLAYGWYAAKPRAWRYALVIVLFAFGLMAKAQVITFPFVLLLWDYWPLHRLGGSDSAASAESVPAGRLSWLILEKVPLLLLSCASAVITMQAQRAGHALRTTTEYSLPARLENAVVSYFQYVGIAFWPSRLAAFYPHPGNSLVWWQVTGATIFVLFITGMVLLYREHRFLPVGWFWFLGTLVPMIGIVQVGEQAMADRYAYLPLIGLFVAVIWGIGEATDNWGVGIKWRAIFAALLLFSLGAVTYRQIGYWHDSRTLWKRTLSITERNYMAQSNLADALAREGLSDEAIVHFRAAEELHNYEPAQVLALGVYEERSGHVQGAIEQYRRVVQASSDPALRVVAFDSLASAYMRIGQVDEAKQNYSNALLLDPEDPVGLTGVGLLALQAGNPAQAAEQFSRVTQIQPTDVGFLLLADALGRAGRHQEATAAYQRAHHLSPNLAEAQNAVNVLLRPRPR